MTEQRTMELLAWQHELTWSLAVLHLDALSEADLHWRPAPISWELRRAPDGSWVPDWSEDELEPIPVPTIGWITWHLGWWWSTALAGSGRTLADLLAWANAELMKNIAEIGQLRLLRAAGADAASWGEPLTSGNR